MDLLSSMLIGVAGSLVASAMFLVVLFKIRPSLEISPVIAKDDVRGEQVHVFKIVNRTSRPIINIRTELVLMQSVNVDGGPMHWMKELKLRKDTVMYLPGYDKKDKNAEYALRLTTLEDIGAIWKSDNDYLELLIVGTDSVSGFSRAFRAEYRTKRNSIADGSHGWGSSLDVK